MIIRVSCDDRKSKSRLKQRPSDELFVEIQVKIGNEGSFAMDVYVEVGSSMIWSSP